MPFADRPSVRTGCKQVSIAWSRPPVEDRAEWERTNGARKSGCEKWSITGDKTRNLNEKESALDSLRRRIDKIGVPQELINNALALDCFLGCPTDCTNRNSEYPVPAHQFAAWAGPLLHSNSKVAHFHPCFSSDRPSTHTVAVASMLIV